jgi:hypothetical protein
MNDPVPFLDWTASQAGVEAHEAEQLGLMAAFEVYVSRVEIARLRGSEDPLAAISPNGGGNSRACTRRMLDHLGYTAAELRVVHRLMSGSASGWPGLIKLYAAQSPVNAAHREYVRRQLQLVTRRSEPSAGAGQARDAS